MKQDLTYGTVFTWGFVIPNINVVEVTSAYIKLLSIYDPISELLKETAQTCTDEKNMQRHLSGVQKRIKDERCTFAVNRHYNMHILQLSAKEMINGHNLVGSVCNKCRVIVKLIYYSPKRTSHFEKVRLCGN